jgi:opacity protein-like surface antigen
MKKIVLLTITLITFIGYAAEAQRRVYRQPSRTYAQPRQSYNSRSNDWYTPTFGVAIGANFSNVIESGYYGNYGSDGLVGLNVGFTADIPVVYPLSFAPEIRYSQKGYSVTDPDGIFTQRTHFIDLPLLAKFKVVPGFNVYAGPQFSFLLSTTNEWDNGVTIIRERYDNEGRDQRTYLDGVLGVSFDINRHVDIHGRYTVDFSAADYRGDTYIPRYRNQVWQIGLGFKF